MLVGTAEILVHANTAGFRKELEDSSGPAFQGLRKDAETAGEDAGAGLRQGVKREAGKLESDLSDIGAAGGLNLRRGVTDETGKLADDVTKDGERAGEGLHKGMSGALSKLGNLISNTGLPLGGLSSGLEKAGDAAEHADSKSAGLSGTLDKLGGAALAGVAAAGVVVAGVGVDMAEKMQTADAAIAGAAGTSVKAASQIGSAFLDTGGKSEFSGVQMATAFASVAGQLKSTEGHALDVAEASKVMAAADDLATAKQVDLGTATSTVAGIMQAFSLKAGDAGHVSDVLYTTSSATGQSIDTLGSQLEKVRSKLGETGGSLGDLAGLLVDMTDRGITGRAALAALNSGMNTLQKTAEGVTVAQQSQKTVFDQMPPSLQALANAYRDGSITSAEFTKQTNGLPPQQAELAKAFATATTAIQTAQLKYKDLGVTVFDASGRFVGMGSIIDQLHPKFALMTQDQQLAAATTLFGAGAARQMVQVIQAGPDAYNKATAAVSEHGAAQAAAAKQAQTLHVEEETLKAEMEDLAAKVGAVLIPILTAMIGVFVKATTFVTDHKAVLIALAAVVTGILGPAIAVFTINKMAAFGQSFSQASGHVKQFASDVQSAVQKVIGLFTQQTDAADTAATKLGTATSTMASETSTAAGTIEGDNAAAGTSFTAVATEADTAAAGVGTAEATMTGEVATADSAIETENAAAGASFAAILGPLAIVGAVGYGLAASGSGNPLAFKPGEQAVGRSPLHTPGTKPYTINSAGRAGGLGGGDYTPNAVASLPIPGVGSTAGIPNVYSVPNLDAAKQHPVDTAKISSRIHMAGDAFAKVASSGNLTKSQLEQLWIEAGGKPQDAAMAAAIALAESSGNPNAKDYDSNGTIDRGLWQINSTHGAQSTFNPFGNAQAAVAISQGGTNWNPWTTFTSGAYKKFLGGSTPASSSPISVAGVNDAIAKQGQSAAQTLTSERNQLAATIAQEKAELARKVAAEKASISGKGVSAAEKQRVDQEIADQKAALSIEVAQQKAALGELSANQKAELKQQTSDAKAGTSQLTKLLAGIHTDSVKSLQTALDNAHTAGLSRIEHDLDRDHNVALRELSKELVAVHAKAMADLVKATAAAAAAAAVKANIALLGKEATDVQDAANRQAALIADQAQTTVDQQAEAGLTGAALVAAQATVAYDQIKQTADQAIGQAQQTLDDDTANGASALQLAQDQFALAQANANATVQEAQAQATVTTTSAAANAANNPSAGVLTGTPTGPAPVFNFAIYGNGTLTAAQLFSEASWALKTGALPVAPPPPVPAAA